MHEAPVESITHLTFSEDIASSTRSVNFSKASLTVGTYTELKFVNVPQWQSNHARGLGSNCLPL